MRTIALISLLILLSSSYEVESPLVSFTRTILSNLNKHLLKPIVALKKEKKTELFIKVTFDDITEKDVETSLEGSDLIHLVISNIKAKAEGGFVPPSRNRKNTITVNGEVQTSLDMKLSIRTDLSRERGRQRKTEVRITDLTVTTNLNSDFDKYSNVEYSEMYEELKKDVEDQIYERFEQEKLQRIIDEAFENMY